MILLGQSHRTATKREYNGISPQQNQTGLYFALQTATAVRKNDTFWLLLSLAFGFRIRGFGCYSNSLLSSGTRTTRARGIFQNVVAIGMWQDFTPFVPKKWCIRRQKQYRCQNMSKLILPKANPHHFQISPDPCSLWKFHKGESIWSKKTWNKVWNKHLRGGKCSTYTYTNMSMYVHGKSW